MNRRNFIKASVAFSAGILTTFSLGIKTNIEQSFDKYMDNIYCGLNWIPPRKYTFPLKSEAGDTFYHLKQDRVYTYNGNNWCLMMYKNESIP